VDCGRGDRRVTGGDRELMKIANDVPCRVETFHACPLLRVDDHVAEFGAVVVEFRTADGDALAISVPAGETRVLKHFQERMPYGLFVPDAP
jgi:hypothetical protein